MKPIRSVAELDDALSLPTAGVLDTLRAVSGDVLLLGAGGKLGPTLARMVRRGLDEIGEASRRVVAVSRFFPIPRRRQLGGKRAWRRSPAI